MAAAAAEEEEEEEKDFRLLCFASDQSFRVSVVGWKVGTSKKMLNFTFKGHISA